MKSIQKFLKTLPEWAIFIYLFLSLSVGPLVIFNLKWHQLGTLKLAAAACGPFFFVLGAMGAIVAFLFYYEDLD